MHTKIQTIEKKTKYRLIVILVLFFSLGLTIFSTPGNAKPTQTIYVLKDAYVRDDYPSNNYGTSYYCRIHNTTEIAESLFLFELPFNYNEYDNIVFSFYAYFDDGTSPLEVYIYNVSESWDESTVTWDTRPSHSVLLLATSIAEGYQSIDVKDIVTSTNFSICITAAYPQTTRVRISARESGGTDPAITLSDDPAPAVDSLPGYDLLIVLGLSSVMIIVVTVRKHKIR